MSYIIKPHNEKSAEQLKNLNLNNLIQKQNDMVSSFLHDEKVIQVIKDLGVSSSDLKEVYTSIAERYTHDLLNTTVLTSDNKNYSYLDYCLDGEKDELNNALEIVFENFDEAHCELFNRTLLNNVWSFRDIKSNQEIDVNGDLLDEVTIDELLSENDIQTTNGQDLEVSILPLYENNPNAGFHIVKMLLANVNDVIEMQMQPLMLNLKQELIIQPHTPR